MKFGNYCTEKEKAILPLTRLPLEPIVEFFVDHHLRNIVQFAEMFHPSLMQTLPRIQSSKHEAPCSLRTNRKQFVSSLN